MKQWERSDMWQRGLRNRFLVPVYKQWCDEGRYVFIQKSDCSTLLQKRYALDTILQVHDRSVCLEEKIVRQPWPFFFFETDSCTLPERESEGWMQYIQADAVLYAFFREAEQVLDTYVIEQFQEVKMWFWQVYTRYREHTMPTENRTRGRLVPIEDVSEMVQVKRYYIYDHGVYKPMSLPRKKAVV